MFPFNYFARYFPMRYFCPAALPVWKLVLQSNPSYPGNSADKMRVEGWITTQGIQFLPGP